MQISVMEKSDQGRDFNYGSPDFEIAYRLNNSLIAAIRADNPYTHANGLRIGYLQLQNTGIDACMRVLTFEEGKPTNFSLMCAVGDWSSKLDKSYLKLPLPHPTYNILATPRNYEIIMEDFGKNFNLIFNAPKGADWDKYGYNDVSWCLINYFSSLEPYLK